MMHNNKAMKQASLDLPPVTSHLNGLPIYFLTGEKFLYQTLFCIASLNKCSKEKFRFIIVDDGSFEEEIIAQINRQLPGAQIITSAVIDQNLIKILPEEDYPVLQKKRKEYPHIKKLIDVHTSSHKGWKLVLDSDMLFFGNPTGMISWLKNPSTPLHMVDCAESYGYSHQLMGKLSGHKIPDKANVGAIGLNSDTLDWQKIEYWVKTMEEQEGRSYYLEQALSAMLVAGQNAVVLKESDYIVNPGEDAILNKKGILHHYVDLSKKGYYNVAWRSIVQ